MLSGCARSSVPVAGAALAVEVGLVLASGHALAGTRDDPAAAMTGVVRVNGVTLALRSQLLQGEPDLLAARLAQRWGEPLDVPRDSAGSEGGPVRHRLGRQRGNFHETLSLSAGPRTGTSIALIAVQDLRRAPSPPAPAPFVLPQGMRVISVVEFGAAVVAPRSYALDSAEPPSEALAAVVSAAGVAGWQPIARPGSAAAWVRRGAEELTAIAVRSGARTRVVLLVTAARGPRR